MSRRNKKYVVYAAEMFPRHFCLKRFLKDMIPAVSAYICVRGKKRAGPMKYLMKIRKGIIAEGILILALVAVLCRQEGQEQNDMTAESNIQVSATGDYIKWVDFKVSYEALCRAYDWDIKTHGSETELHWIELLAYAAAKTGGDVDKDACKYIDAAAKKLTEENAAIRDITKDLQYYPYYLQAYSAVLDGFVGEYEAELPDGAGGTKWEKVYGLKAFSPVAKGFYYEDYDDFGASRSYGYARPHLGHDMMGQVGTPIIAIESGTVEALGWNQYGGWRIGIRSHDKKRYYYYAHLRQNYPYADWLEEGCEVTAGDVIGYMGHTGYSTKENVNNIEVTHLHWGLELIFDESQKESNNEIWIDVYALTQFLYKNRSEVVKVEGTKEWVRVYGLREMENNE